MKQTTKNIELEIVNFTMTKLRSFKRIHFRDLTELINSKFSVIGAKTLLLEHLVKTKKTELKRGYLILSN